MISNTGGCQDVEEGSRSKRNESSEVKSKGFVKVTKERLGIRAKGRKVFRNNGAHELREPAAPYMGLFQPKNDVLRLENAYSWTHNL